ncbi:MAG: response regulator [Cyclobacteriaceae bacterium]
MISLILVEDNPITAMSLSLFLKDSSFDVLAELNKGEEVAAKVSQLNPDIVIMDIMLKGEVNGLQAAEEVRKNSEIPILFVSALSDIETTKQINAIPNCAAIVKPFDYEHLELKIRELVKEETKGID